MKNLYIRKLLSDEQIQTAKELVKSLKWGDGKKTSSSSGKVVYQALDNTSQYVSLDNLVVNSLISDNGYDAMTAPKATTYSLISKMEVGGKYPLHNDNFDLGHYSTTTFLSDPSEYEGGELCLYINGKVEEIKLSAGHSVTYLTGTPHEVREVVSGCRVVSVNWTTSHFNSTDMREIYSDVTRCINMLECYDGDDFEDAINHPRHILSEVSQKLMRMTL